MTHPRQLIRGEIVQALQAVGIVPPSQVLYNRTLNVWDLGTLPVINVVMNDEPATVSEFGVDLYVRELDVSVEAVILEENPEDLDDELQELAEAIETALRADPRLNGQSIDVTLTRTSFGVDSNGEVNAGRVTLNFTVKYEY